MQEKHLLLSFPIKVQGDLHTYFVVIMVILVVCTMPSD